MIYIVNKNAQIENGYHKIHTLECRKKPKKGNTIYLDECICPVIAKDKARKYYSNVVGCKYCCKEIYF